MVHTGDASLTLEAIFGTLTNARIIAVARELGVALPASGTKAALAKRFASVVREGLYEVLHLFTRDELRTACEAAGLNESGRARVVFINRLLEAAGEGAAVSRGDRAGHALDPDDAMPRRGDIVLCRQRQYLVDEDPDGGGSRDMTRVSLTCLDDDRQGESLEVLWELELGARVVRPHQDGLGEVRGLDDPRAFAAWLYALRWNAVTATDATLFQAPFRAGIQLQNHQLTPLDKALRLPRANLFIADDVGVGKTIEAGLVLQELTLRQRVDFTLVVCPASIVLQWRDELERRFGQRFAIYTRAFVARRRQERGYSVNPWATHKRFIISMPMLRRPEHHEKLLQLLGDRAPKSLLVLDEAHHAAPSSGTKYAVDTQLTRTVRDVAKRFENRLFLSATPHNGHSNSFSALLNIMDPQRFTPGVPIKDPAELDPVMVRRLKPDLRELGSAFPRRHIVEFALRHENGEWQCTPSSDGHDEPTRVVGTGDDGELALARMLAEYTELACPTTGRGKLVFINLQKRLLSSVQAFHRTLEAHAKAVHRRANNDAKDEQVTASTNDGAEQTREQLSLADATSGGANASSDADAYGSSEQAAAEVHDAEMARESETLDVQAQALTLLGQMREMAAAQRHQRDAKVLALLDWMRERQCPSAGLAHGQDLLRESNTTAPESHSHAWSNTRLLIFTEYSDTASYLAKLLGAAIAHTDEGDERIMRYHGGMSDEKRDEVQRAFNSDPEREPVRILIATDAAREGVNLQSACADLVHFDIPWNPARIEQRNGRIDRKLQPASDVYCRYFVYPQRPEDRVLQTLVRKVDVIQRELGSLGAVLMDRMESALEDGLNEHTVERIEAEERAARSRGETSERELESQRQLKRLKREFDRAGRVLDNSRRTLGHDTTLLRRVVSTGLQLILGHELNEASPLRPASSTETGGIDGAWRLPDMPQSWQSTLDTVRPRRAPDEPFWEHRKKRPMPVVFDPPGTMTTAVSQLHLEHPFVKRVLARFLAQGWSASDLNRVSVLQMPGLSTPHTVAYGRLSLFGGGAARLHEQLVTVAAPWSEENSAVGAPLDDADEQRLLAQLDAAVRERFERLEAPQGAAARLRAHAAADFTALWTHVHDEATALAHDARRKLRERGDKEAEDLTDILLRQRDRIHEEIAQVPLNFADTATERAEQRQFERNLAYMEKRSVAIAHEIEAEPEQLKALYDVDVERIEPLGLLYLWPETR